MDPTIDSDTRPVAKSGSGFFSPGAFSIYHRPEAQAQTQEHTKMGLKQKK